MTQPFCVFMRAGGGGRDACPTSAPFPFSWANGADGVVQTDFSTLSRLWSIPAGGDDGAGEAFPRALALPVTHSLCPLQPKPRSSAPENAVLCMCPCSALHSPSQRAAYAHAARCPFLSYRGSGHRAAHSAPVPRLRHHSSVCTVMNWAPDFGGAWHGTPDFL